MENDKKEKMVFGDFLPAFENTEYELELAKNEKQSIAIPYMIFKFNEDEFIHRVDELNFKINIFYNVNKQFPEVFQLFEYFYNGHSEFIFKKIELSLRKKEKETF